jgi:hypothetical protein
LNVLQGLQQLAVGCVHHGQQTSDPHIQEHMLRGAGRRLAVLRRSIENIYSLFPLNATEKLSRDTLSDVQINLHAFVINLYGVFDNFAWAFVLRHNLVTIIGGRKRVGMFNAATQHYLPDVLKSYLKQESVSWWFDMYLKEYRDALAHRIPLYIPPFTVTENEGEKYNTLEVEKLQCIKAVNWRRLDEIYVEQEAIGVPCYTFLHAFAGGEPPRPVFLHPQVLSDGKTVMEFGELFLKHWHERT